MYIHVYVYVCTAYMLILLQYQEIVQWMQSLITDEKHEVSGLIDLCCM